ncbi:MAG: hypothetical protein PPHEINF_2601 [uncultured Paraburkholderia sp.]|nr:MAG: hypothetical protein PPHEINF_2601 [uncultured Paraburkholderia sp.]CAH2923487.1 MAG: hypothetical protein PPHEMADMSA_2621 [uncultured Paraburkholderia sp.]CAH2923959.1 MAG: hypothetical protein PPHERAN_2637 [uncultured Paraburkholderia sp.]
MQPIELFALALVFAATGFLLLAGLLIARLAAARACWPMRSTSARCTARWLRMRAAFTAAWRRMRQTMRHTRPARQARSVRQVPRVDHMREAPRVRPASHARPA